MNRRTPGPIPRALCAVGLHKRVDPPEDMKDPPFKWTCSRCTHLERWPAPRPAPKEPRNAED